METTKKVVDRKKQSHQNRCWAFGCGKLVTKKSKNYRDVGFCKDHADYYESDYGPYKDK